MTVNLSNRRCALANPGKTLFVQGSCGSFYEQAFYVLSITPGATPGVANAVCGQTLSGNVLCPTYLARVASRYRG
jgi:hypothetical protein